MALQFSNLVRNVFLSGMETTIGASPRLRVFTGGPPANCAAASAGTLIVDMALPSDWMATPFGGSASKLGVWSGITTGAGTAGHYRLFDAAGTTCHEQGTISQAISLLTTAATAPGGNVLTFASTAGIVVGQGVSGAGIPAATTVSSLTGTTVTLSSTSTAGVANGALVSFGDVSGDLQLNNTLFAIGQLLTIDEKILISPGA